MSKEDNKNVDNDYEYSREVLFDLIEKGRGALEDMIEVARESEHPRAFEVLSQTIKNISDVTKNLMDLQKAKKDLTQEEREEAKKVTNNNVFVGSTTDLQRMLLDKDNVIDATDVKE